MSELDEVRQRYARRSQLNLASRYDPTLSSVYLCAQEKERALIRWIRCCGIAPVHNRRLLEIGCGIGSNLLTFLQLGFRPENLAGNELLEERFQQARRRLPAVVQLYPGDAAEFPGPADVYDVVYQSTVFTSILDEATQRRVADRMWQLAKPGGGILWYDFIYDNPSNPDVRGFPLRKLERLFPAKPAYIRRLTLAPPICRRVVELHPAFYGFLNALPFLRTHVLCWIPKPE